MRDATQAPNGRGTAAELGPRPPRFPLPQHSKIPGAFARGPAPGTKSTDGRTPPAPRHTAAPLRKATAPGQRQPTGGAGAGTAAALTLIDGLECAGEVAVLAAAIHLAPQPRRRRRPRGRRHLDTGTRHTSRGRRCGGSGSAERGPAPGGAALFRQPRPARSRC